MTEKGEFLASFLTQRQAWLRPKHKPILVSAPWLETRRARLFALVATRRLYRAQLHRGDIVVGRRGMLVDPQPGMYVAAWKLMSDHQPLIWWVHRVTDTRLDIYHCLTRRQISRKTWAGFFGLLVGVIRGGLEHAEFTETGAIVLEPFPVKPMPEEDDLCPDPAADGPAPADQQPDSMPTSAWTE